MKNANERSLPVVEERRDFLQKCASAFAGATLVGFVAPLLGGCEPSFLPTPPENGGNGGVETPEGIAFDVSSLDVDGKSVATTIKGSDGFPILIVRRSASEYLSLSMRCTHQSCVVDKRVPTGGPISCACHGSQFNLDGSVRRGPAAAPLKSYITTFDSQAKIVRVKVT